MSKFFENYTRCGAVRLAHLLWEQGVAGSNPATSTEEKLKTPRDRGVFYYLPIYSNIVNYYQK